MQRWQQMRMEFIMASGGRRGEPVVAMRQGGQEVEMNAQTLGHHQLVASFAVLLDLLHVPS